MVSSVPVIHAKKEKKKPPTYSRASSAFMKECERFLQTWFMESLSLFCCGVRTRGGGRDYMEQSHTLTESALFHSDAFQNHARCSTVASVTPNNSRNTAE